VVVAIDAKRDGGRFEVCSQRAARRPGGAVAWLARPNRAARRDSPDVHRRDGTLQGFDCRLTARVGRGRHPGDRLRGAGSAADFVEVSRPGAPMPPWPPPSSRRHLPCAGVKDALAGTLPAPVRCHADSSIDLRGGRVVQLVQGAARCCLRRRGGVVQRFSGYARVQVIDLDARRNGTTATSSPASAAGSPAGLGRLRTVEAAGRASRRAREIILAPRSSLQRLNAAFAEAAPSLRAARVIAAVDAWRQ